MQNPIEQVITAIISPNNVQREQAEAQLEVLCRDQTSQTLHSFLEVMVQKTNLAELASMLIQKKIVTNKENTSKLTTEDFKHLIEVCSQLVENTQTSLSTLKRISEILVQLFRTVSSSDDYNREFFDLIKRFGHNPNKNVKLFMIYTLETFAEFTYNEKILVNHSENFATYFHAYLSDPDQEVRLDAASSFTNFLSYFQEEKNVESYKSAFPTLLKSLIDAVKSDEQKGLKMVNSLDHLVKSHPNFIKESQEDLINVVTEMAGEKSLSPGLRSAAMLFLITICTKNSTSVKKSKTFTDKTLPVLMAVLTEQPDDLTEWLKSEDTHELSTNNVQATATENFSRLNEALGPKFMLTKTIKMAFNLIQSDNWKEKYAGLTSLAMLFEGSKKFFENDLDNFIKLLTPTLQFSHPKVLYASMTCIALLATEFSPEFQTKYHSVIIPPVLHILANSPEQKLRVRAVSMLINLYREILDQDEEEREHMDKYIPQIMDSLIKLFEGAVAENRIDTVEEVVSLISILAAVASSKFINYYHLLMPGMKNLIVNTPNDTDARNKLRTLTISCMGYIISSYRDNPQAIEEDIMFIMNYLVGLQNSLAEDDSQHKAILEVYEVLVGALKEKFLPFMDKVVEESLKCARRDIQFHVEDHLGGAPIKKDKNEQSMIIDLKIMGGQKMISMNHNTLEQKVIAFDMIRQMSKVLKKHLRPYLDQLVTVVYENLDFKFSTAIRDFCYKCMKHLMGVCTTEEESLKIFELFAPKIFKSVNEFIETENDEKLQNILKHIKQAVEPLKTVQISDNTMNMWFNVLAKSLTVCEKLKGEIKSEWGDLNALDADEREDFEAEFAEPNMIMHAVMETAGMFMTNWKTKYEQKVINELGMYFYGKSVKYDSEDEIHYSTFFYAELMNNCSSNSVNEGYSVVLRNCLPAIEKTEDVNLQQTGSFLIGILAKRTTREQFAPFLAQSLSILTKYLSEPDAQSEDKKIRTETVLGAFGKLCMYQLDPSDGKNQERTLNFVKSLPLQTDPEEAQYINRLFLKELNRQNQSLLFTDPLKSASRDALIKMNQLATSNPELEILADDGLALLQQTISKA